MPEYLIGSQQGVQIRYNDAMVSRQHAKLIIDQQGQYWIEDLFSSNGTTINGVSIGKKLLQPNDRISFAGRINTDLLSLLKQVNMAVAINHLKKIDDDYQAQKKKIKDGQLMGNLIRIVPMSLLSTISLVVGKNAENPQLMYMLSGASVVVLIILVYLSHRKSQAIEKELYDLNQRFQMSYRCPNASCNRPLGDTSYSNLLQQEKCISCKTRYYES